MRAARPARIAMAVAVVLGLAAGTRAQTPRPFPVPGKPAPPSPAEPAPQPPGQAVPTPPAPSTTGEPGEQTLGVPVYPAAQYLTSYDAGRGQRFYLFGANAPYADMVQYYRAALQTRGDELYPTPPTHQFEIGRFRDDVMAFPPTVTIKDYTWGGAAGYPNPRPGVEPTHFPTVIQIVPLPPGASPER